MVKVNACSAMLNPPNSDHPDCKDGTGTKPCTAYMELVELAIVALEHADNLDSDYVDDIVAECKRAGRLQMLIEGLKFHRDQIAKD